MRKGIHPLVRSMTVVMRNGASFSLRTVLNRSTPFTLQADTTTHSAWTGKKTGLSMEDERTARLLRRFDFFTDDSETVMPPKLTESSEEQPTTLPSTSSA